MNSSFKIMSRLSYSRLAEIKAPFVFLNAFLMDAFTGIIKFPSPIGSKLTFSIL